MDVRLPKLGEGAESGTVVAIFVKEGDQVAKGQNLIELENEKAVAPIPSTAAGRVAKVRVKEGDKLSVGQVILTLEDGAGAAAEKATAKSTRPAAAKEAPEPSQEPAETPAETVAEAEEEYEGTLPPPASPDIRRIARELGLDLRRIKGSERGGRIVMADLRAYIARLQRLASQAKGTPAARSAATAARQRIDFSQWGPVTQKPLSPLRQTISQRLTESWTTIPHVTQFDEADITALNELRKKYASAYEQKGARLTVTSFILKAVTATLQKHPIFNASLDEVTHEIVYKNYFHVGIAVDTEQGLMVPVIRQADKKSVLELSRELVDLAEKARARKLTREDMQGGTFTISNQGGIGGAHFTPIINKPEAAILGLGRGALKAVPKGSKTETRLLMPLGLSYDHRLIDGGSAARFIVDLVQAIENFREEEVKV